jgi:hypothetical protein
MGPVAYEKPASQEKAVCFDKKAAWVAVHNLELVFGKIYSISIPTVGNRLLQIDPQFYASISVGVPTSEPQNVTGGGHAFICSSFLDSHGIEAKLFHLGK